ncbi:hypothetical protein PN36_13860 [Candidatus Thiomargarita nelsonii]|uniref:Uncharacterized protein n=1 Tax=Candidatus Thiomargarita nelsonii TaxID=1003181 RepID=A0A4E0R3W3_9GAMM|nr:hypothetical protein PN36_13860 [Candidatus Thiomargarita nelsonii]
MDILWQYPNPEWVPVSHLGSLRYESIESVMARWDWDKLCFHWGKVRQLVFNLHFEAKVFAVLMRKLLPRKENL